MLAMFLLELEVVLFNKANTYRSFWQSLPLEHQVNFVTWGCPILRQSWYVLGFFNFEASAGLKNSQTIVGLIVRIIVLIVVKKNWWALEVKLWKSRFKKNVLKICACIKKRGAWPRFEPTRAAYIGLAVQRLNHSARATVGVTR